MNKKSQKKVYYMNKKTFDSVLKKTDNSSSSGIAVAYGIEVFIDEDIPDGKFSFRPIREKDNTQ